MAYQNLQKAVMNGDENSLSSGLYFLGEAWDGLFGMAAECYSNCNTYLNYDGICGMELMQLNSDFTFAQDNT